MMDKVIYIGMDIGKDGYTTILKDGEFIFYAMPEHKVETGKLLKSGKPQMKKVFHEEGLVTMMQLTILTLVTLQDCRNL